jgi:hypothetical protein
MKDPINYDNVMEFKDIPDGAHFKELGINPRRFIKIKCSYASGIPFKVYTIHLGEDDAPKLPDWKNDLNCLDYKGIFGKCPPWVKFEVIPTP